METGPGTLKSNERPNPVHFENRAANPAHECLPLGACGPQTIISYQRPIVSQKIAQPTHASSAPYSSKFNICHVTGRSCWKSKIYDSVSFLLGHSLRQHWAYPSISCARAHYLQESTVSHFQSIRVSGSTFVDYHYVSHIQTLSLRGAPS